MASKNFSLFMALRYLNPLRAHMSVITIISLLGVATGVMVLVVVLSVMNGFEGFLKKQVLGESPHISLQYQGNWELSRNNIETDGVSSEWREIQQQLSDLPSVKSAYPYVTDYVIVDLHGQIRPSYIRALDTENTAQLEELQEVIKEGNGTADMGLGEVCVISSTFREEFALELGDMVQVHSHHSFKKVKPIFERMELEPVYFRYEGVFESFLHDFDQEWEISANPKTNAEENKDEQVPGELVRAFALNLIIPIRDNIWNTETLEFVNPRGGEVIICKDILKAIKTDRVKDTETDIYYYKKGKLKEIQDLILQLKNADTETMDNEDLRALDEIILPKELKVVGIYDSNKFTFTPEILVPLSIGQDLANLEDGIHALGMKLENADDAQAVLDSEVSKIADKSPHWHAVTWMKEHEQHFSAVILQKRMMIIALSFIVLVAVFSISAVMFTVTIQKKREIGVMKALGSTPWQIMSVFLLQGVIVGLLGALIGVGLGLLVVKYIGPIQSFIELALGVNPFPAELYPFDSLPTQVKTAEVVTIGIGAFIFCSLATLLPAWFASRTDAARSLRNL